MYGMHVNNSAGSISRTTATNNSQNDQMHILHEAHKPQVTWTPSHEDDKKCPQDDG